MIYSAVDLVLFCALSDLQVRLYRALLKSRGVSACLRYSDTAQHLRCISALKKLCNHAHLLRAVAMETRVNGFTANSPEVRRRLQTWINMIESLSCYGLLCMSVCMSVCNVRESRQEFLTDDIPVWHIICSIHLVIRHTKADKYNPPLSFLFPVPKWRGYGKS
jgi:hypothetical protein